MSLPDALMITDSAAFSAVIWLTVLIVVMYFARPHAHYALRSLSRVIANTFRLGATAVTNGERKLTSRNREVLLAAGREATERIIEREFDRVGDSVRRDLAGYPSMQRKLNEEVEKLEKDHEDSIEVPPSPPGWVKAVEAVANIPSKSEYMVGNVLADIHKSLVRAHKQAMAEYQEGSRIRHKLLRDMRGHWRRVLKTLDSVNKNVTNLLSRASSIDRHMDEYEDIAKGSDRAVQKLSSSSLIQFFVSAFVLAVAIGGAMINFSLIARPMAEMVGGTSFIGGFRTADIAALVIIMVEISMGLFLMESLRITRLFPVIGALPDKLRVKMIWVTFSILLLLASVEAGLAYMREILMQDELATSALLRGGAETIVGNEFLWITTAAQMGMGFILPFALVFVAIPLETFVHSLRTVLGMVGVGILRVTALVLRLVAGVIRYAGSFFLHVYDLVIFAPLWMERLVRRRAADDDEDLEVEPEPAPRSRRRKRKSKSSALDADDLGDSVPGLS